MGRRPLALREGSPVPSPVQPEEARRAVSKAALILSKDRMVITPHLDPQLPLALRDGAKEPRLLRTSGEFRSTKGPLTLRRPDGPVLSASKEGERRRALPEERHPPHRPPVRVETEGHVSPIASCQGSDQRRCPHLG
jgi:hypothetical protein